MKNISNFLFEALDLNEGWSEIIKLYGENSTLSVTYNNGRYEDPLGLMSVDNEFKKYDDIVRSNRKDKCPCKDAKLKATDKYLELHACDMNGDWMHWIYIVNSKDKFVTYVCDEDYNLIVSFDSLDESKCKKLLMLMDDLVNFEYDEEDIMTSIDDKLKAI